MLFNRFYFKGLGLFLVLISSGCFSRTDSKPIPFQVSIPQANTVQFQAQLAEKYGMGLGGSFQIKNYGSIFMVGETPTENFKFGFQLHTDAFLKQNWVNYQEVSGLPTGAAFPAWMGGPVLDVVVPPANSKDVNWHFYLGVRGQMYVGAAAVISKIDGSIPPINLQYAFYDPQGRVILGLLFFGPRIDAGRLASPGGIFVGTNVTPFLQGLKPGTNMVSSTSLASTSAFELVNQANAGKPIQINGQSVSSDIRISGPGANKYNSAKKVKTLISRFMSATQN